jgi:AhpC/TSA family
MVRAKLSALLLLPPLAGCGSNAPEIPPELLATSSGCGAPSYPSGPYGNQEGDVVENACFEGFRAPNLIEPSAERLETLAFSDSYDPQGTKGIALLLINTAAIWCGPCQREHEDLDQRAAMYAPQGFTILSTLFQDANHDPATEADLVNWVQTFDSNFPMAVDPAYQLERYALAQTAPLNLIVDPRSMTILRKFIGEQPTVMWPYIESELERRAGNE